MTQAVSKNSTTQAQQQQVQQQNQHARDTQTTEHTKSANASAGLNLNLGGALGGAFSSKSKKTTQTNPDGSSMSVEDKHDQGSANAAAHGNGSAYGAAGTQDTARKQNSREIGQGASQVKQVQGQKIDHLGIEN